MRPSITFHGLPCMAGAMLLQHFSWLLILFAAFLFISGIRMLVSDDTVAVPDLDGSKADRPSDDEGARETDAFAVRCLGACVPLYWSDSTADRYFARNERGQLCATRMATEALTHCPAAHSIQCPTGPQHPMPQPPTASNAPLAH